MILSSWQCRCRIAAFPRPPTRLVTSYSYSYLEAHADLCLMSLWWAFFAPISMGARTRTPNWRSCWRCGLGVGDLAVPHMAHGTDCCSPHWPTIHKEKGGARTLRALLSVYLSCVCCFLANKSNETSTCRRETSVLTMQYLPRHSLDD